VSRFIRDRAFNPAAIGEAEIEHYARSLAAPGALRGSLGYYRTFEEDAAVNRALAKEKLRIPVLGIGGDKRWGQRCRPLSIMWRSAERARRCPIAATGCRKSARPSWRRYSWIS